jgi:tetratricopeptide (TPR) repeat protein
MQKDQAKYNPSIFNQKDLDEAKRIILTNEKDISSETRWENETPYLVNSISSKIVIDDKSVIVDFGCGIGRLSKELIEKFNCQVVGVDISSDMRGHARKYVNSKNFQAVSPSQFREIILKGVRFDAAIAVWVLQHCIDPLSDIVMLKTALKKEGLFYVLNNVQSAIPTDKGWISNKIDMFELLGEFFELKIKEKLPKDAGNEYISKHTFESLYMNTSRKKHLYKTKENEKKASLAIRLYNEKKYHEAIVILEELVLIESNNPNIFSYLGVVYKSLGKYDEAIKAYNKAISLDKFAEQNYNNLANLFKILKNYKEAIKLFLFSIKLNPLNYNAYNNLGILYESIGDDTKAIVSYKEAIRINPNFSKAVNNIGVVLYKQKKYDESANIFQIALNIDPEYNEVYSNMGASLNKAKRYDESILSLEKAIERLPNHSGAYTNLGNVYNKIFDYKKAAKYHEKSIALDPSGYNAYSNLGTSYKNQGFTNKAIESYIKAIELKPDFENAHFDLSTVYLAKGDFKNGLAEYEWRFKKDEMKFHIVKHKHIFSKPMMKKGQDIKGKTVLVHSEQGFGDSIMYARFLKELKNLGCILAVECRDELKTLFSTINEIDILVGRDELKTPNFDFHLPMMSLAYILDVKKYSDFPSTPYFEVTKDEKFNLTSEKIKIGLCWSASSTGESFDGKVFDLINFEPLVNNPKIQLYSIQVGEGSEQIKENGFEDKIIDLTDDLTDFSKTASLMNELDLVISSDTSVTHLAGAIGVKTYTLLQKYPDWRWLNKGETSYLYPNMKLFRQKQNRVWQTVFQSLFAKMNKEYKLKLKI